MDLVDIFTIGTKVCSAIVNIKDSIDDILDIQLEDDYEAESSYRESKYANLPAVRLNKEDYKNIVSSNEQMLLQYIRRHAKVIR